MPNTSVTETDFEDEFEREKAELVKRAEEKPTLRMINAEEAKTIDEWKELYPERALFIEVTKEDFSKIYEGKLIATAENSIEFLDLHQEYRRRGTVNLTTFGDPIGKQPIPLPAVFLVGIGKPE